MAASDGTADPLIIVISGPGGVGKGTIVNALVERDPNLWLSRSWTTRRQRPASRIRRTSSPIAPSSRSGLLSGGFLEWTKFLDNYYGTPTPEVLDGRDVVLEIEVDGASQVKRLHRDAVLIFVLPPSRDEQQRRLRGRGDPEDKVDQRLRKALDEEPVGLALADHVVVNDDLERTVDEMLSIIARHRRSC